MLYNKNNVSKINDKKVLHKVGKQWKVISVALLMAIGGGALATHVTANANADSTNGTNANTENVSAQSGEAQNTNSDANYQMNNTKSGFLGATQSATSGNTQTSATQSSATQSNNSGMNLSGVTSANVQKIQSLTQAPQVQSAVQPSANAPRVNSNGQTNSGSVSYQNNDNGSAASYHANVQSLAPRVQSESTTLSGYTQSLNSKFPSQVKSLNTASASASANFKVQSSNVAHFNNLASLSNRNDLISDAAQKNNMTVSDFTQSIDGTYSWDTQQASSASTKADYANRVNSYAQLINKIKNDPTVSAEYAVKDANAQVNSAYANAHYTALSEETKNLSGEAQKALSDSDYALALNTNDQIAMIESGADNTYVNSVAQSLGYSNESVIRSAIYSYVNNSANYASSASNGVKSLKGNDVLAVSDANKSNSTVNLSGANLDQVLSNTAVMNSYANALSKLSDGNDFASLSNEYKNANSALALATTESTSASVAYRNAHILANASGLSFNNIMGNPVSSLTNALNSTEVSTLASATGLALGGSSFANSASGLMRQISYNSDTGSLANVSAGNITTAFGLTNANSSEVNKFASAVNNTINSVNSTEASTELMASNANLGATSFATELASAGTNNSSASSSALNAVSGMASLADSTNASDTSALNSYTANSDVQLVEAKSLATSASAVASSASADVANANKALNDFYNANTDNNYTKVHDAYAKDSVNFANDQALEMAYGMHVYNYAPKYITNVKGMLLHQHTNFAEDLTGTQYIRKGTQLHVLGVGFAVDGTLRYVVDFNGTRGFVTGNTSFVTPTYLTANKHVQVNVLKGAQEYASATDYTNPVGHVNAGDSFEGTTVAVPDDNYDGKAVYGAFTRIKLANGNYMTANTKYVSAVDVPANTNNASSASSKASQKANTASNANQTAQNTAPSYHTVNFADANE